MPGGYAVVDQAKNNLKKLETYISTGMVTCADLSYDIVDHDKDNCQEKVDMLKEIMVNYVEMEQDLQQFLQATDSVTLMARASEANTGDLEKLLDSHLEELRSQSNTDYKKHERYVEMVSKIEDLQESGNAAGDSTPDHDPTQQIDDMLMTQEIITKCPYTGMDMKNPVTNKHCKHNYEKVGIMEAMNHRQGRTKCPVPGCINEKPISIDDLEDNRQLRRYIENKQRQQQKRGRKN